MTSTEIITEEAALDSRERLAAQWLHADDGVIYIALGGSLSEELRSWWKDVLAYTDQLIEPEVALVDPNDPRNQCTIQQVTSYTVSSGNAGIYQSATYSYSLDASGNPFNYTRSSPGSITLAESAYSHSIHFADSREAGWKHVAFHELGHALALEHPHDFEDGDGDSEVDTNTTVMSYNSATDEDGDPGYTALDREALALIHGIESGAISTAAAGYQLLRDTDPVRGLQTWKTPSLKAEFVGGAVVQEPTSGKTLKQLKLSRYDGNMDEAATVNLQWTFDDDLNWYYHEGYAESFHDITLEDAFSVDFSPQQSEALVDIWIIANPQDESDEWLEVTLTPARTPDYFLSAPTEPLRLTITEGEIPAIDEPPSDDTSSDRPEDPSPDLSEDPIPDPAIPTKGIDIYRFYNAGSGVHFYTPSPDERDAVRSKPEWGYSYEGVAYQALSTGGVELFRFYNAGKGYHFMTTNELEAENIKANPDWGYGYEGRTYRVSTSKGDEVQTAVYRFYKPSAGVHFYSSSLSEVQSVIDKSLGEGYEINNAIGVDDLIANGWGYQLEGVAWYV